MNFFYSNFQFFEWYFSWIYMIVNFSIKAYNNFHVIDQGIFYINGISFFISYNSWNSIMIMILIWILMMNSLWLWLLQLFLCFFYKLIKLMKSISRCCSMIIKIFRKIFETMRKVFYISPRSKWFSSFDFILYCNIIWKVWIIYISIISK